MRRATARIAAMVFGLLLGLALAEGVVRTYDPLGISYSRLMTRYQQVALRPSAIPGLCYEHVSGTSVVIGVDLRFNRLGLRGPELELPKPQGRYRVLVLGDSVTLGWGVREPETFPRRLEQLLARHRSGGDVEVANAGVVGYNTEQEACFLEARGPQLEPDLVLVVCCSNDVLIESDAPVRPPPPAPERPASLDGVVSALEWWILTGPARLDVMHLLRFATLVRLLNPPADDAERERYADRIARIKAFVQSGRATTDPARSDAALERIIRYCQERNIAVAIASYDPTPWVEARCRALGAPWIPPPGIADDRDLQVSRVDGHPNAAGHARIATHLASHLKEIIDP